MIDWPDIVDLHADRYGRHGEELDELHRKVGELLCERGGVEWVEELMRTNRELLTEMKTENAS